jgi:hypothetical protein
MAAFKKTGKKTREEEFAMLEVLADLILAVEAYGNLDRAIDAGCFDEYSPAWIETFRTLTPARLGGSSSDSHRMANWDSIFQTMMSNDILRESFMRMRMARLYPTVTLDNLMPSTDPLDIHRIN